LHQQLFLTLGLPLRRVLSRPWFGVVVRIGKVGADESFLDPDSESSVVVSEMIRPSRTGELFLYVNDIVLPIPGIANWFYRDHRGIAEVTIRKI
jgi:hypothetical protein